MTTAPAKYGRLPLPPLIYLSALALGILAHFFYALPWFGSPLADILQAAGWLAIVAAIALFVTAIRAMRAAKTTIDPNGMPEHLVTTGPFAITRNPLYLGNTLILIGAGLAFGIVWLFIAAIVAAFATQKLAVEREEKVLAEKFGKRYRDYAKRVRRWI